MPVPLGALASTHDLSVILEQHVVLSFGLVCPLVVQKLVQLPAFAPIGLERCHPIAARLAVRGDPHGVAAADALADTDEPILLLRDALRYSRAHGLGPCGERISTQG